MSITNNINLKINQSIKKTKIVKKTKTTKKDVSDIYKKMSHVEHVLNKPDSYVGSTQIEETQQYVLESIDDKVAIVKKNFNFCPAFYKCFDELLVNAFDHSKRQLKKISDGEENILKVTNIRVEILKEENTIIVFNDGDGIDIEIIPEYKLYPPELIFGTLLTSTNYDDSDEREWGGKNGYGAKLANIFSTEMVVETVDRSRGKKFKQIFTNNMSDKTKPKITSFNGKPFTRITWKPDFKRFNMTELDDAHIKLLKKRVYDIAACTDKDVNVFLDNKKITEKTFEKYVDLYIGDKKTKPRIYQYGDGWSVIATYNDSEEFEQVSFVNGINTIRGGKHVDYIVEQIKEKLSLVIKKKRKINVKSAYVKNQLMVFVNSTIVNPVFDGQTKETLKTNKKQFKHYIDLDNKFIDKLYKTEITNLIIQHTNYKENKDLAKTDGKKKGRIKVEKLSDANWAGTKKSKECTLILTEGDSAKSMAIAGLSVVGRNAYGVFPLRGKLLNVRSANNSDILKNKEISNIKKILGLQSGAKYETETTDKYWPLRYGKIMIMTDQDLDGSHIKGLVINLFDHTWPNLMEKGFICSMITPIIKVKKNKSEKIFYTIQDYDIWKTKPNSKGWKAKYYKGLGTSTTSEAKEYFKQLKVIDYFKDDEDTQLTEAQLDENVNNPDVTDNPNITDNQDAIDNQNAIDKVISNKIDLAFNDKRADDRKKWLSYYDKNNIPNFNDDTMSYNTFIDTEFIHFSNYDNDRSIPDIRDGFKPSIRKIMYSCFKRNLKNEIKVSQLAGYVSENASYHHGEKSLEGAIVGLAHDFVGSNNANLLDPVGQFGTRLMGGKDAAQSRYIHTQLSTISRIMFNSLDEPLYKYLEDDGYGIEPEAYCPILPNILINGGQGIGTGYSTSVPCFNPIDIARCIKNKLKGSNYKDIVPWYRGFLGNIVKINEKTYLTKGIYEKNSFREIRITELPIGTWTEKYIQFLDKITIEKGKPTSKQYILSYLDNSTESKIDILIKFNQFTLKGFLGKPPKDGIEHIEKLLKLTSKISSSNMWLYNTSGKLHKYNTPNDIIDEWYPYRLNLYVERKAYILKKLKKELNIIKFKVKFIFEFINGTIEIRNKSKANILNILDVKKYPKLSLKIDDDSIVSYDYLLKMDLYKLTKEEIEELNKKKEFKQLEVNTLENTSINDIWNDEIDKFVHEYKKILKKPKLVIKKKNKTTKSKKTTK